MSKLVKAGIVLTALWEMIALIAGLGLGGSSVSDVAAFFLMFSLPPAVLWGIWWVVKK